MAIRGKFNLPIDIKPDVVNSSGRYYTKESLEKAFEEYNLKENHFITIGKAKFEHGIPIEDIIARFESIEKIGEEYVLKDVIPIENHKHGIKDFTPLLECCSMMPNGFGAVSIGGKVEHFKIQSFNLVFDPTKEDKNENK